MGEQWSDTLVEQDWFVAYADYFATQPRLDELLASGQSTEQWIFYFYRYLNTLSNGSSLNAHAMFVEFYYGAPLTNSDYGEDNHGTLRTLFGQYPVDWQDQGNADAVRQVLDTENNNLLTAEQTAGLYKEAYALLEQPFKDFCVSFAKLGTADAGDQSQQKSTSVPADIPYWNKAFTSYITRTANGDWMDWVRKDSPGSKYQTPMVGHMLQSGSDWKMIEADDLPQMAEAQTPATAGAPPQTLEEAIKQNHSVSALGMMVGLKDQTTDLVKAEKILKIMNPFGDVHPLMIRALTGEEKAEQLSDFVAIEDYGVSLTVMINPKANMATIDLINKRVWNSIKGSDKKEIPFMIYDKLVFFDDPEHDAMAYKILEALPGAQKGTLRKIGEASRDGKKSGSMKIEGVSDIRFIQSYVANTLRSNRKIKK